ncbi:hypothetical protein RCC89_12605 [Cytophagaceae bacterium ABcell3]|nr:hypothetical protein RCC89_12605 [Cytophagaceae bacterium ABcell3]
MKKIKRLNHIKNLYLVATADGPLNRYEEAFIKARAKSLNLSENEYDFENIQRVTSIVPEKLGNRILQVYDMVNLILIDNVIHESELATCRAIANHLNLAEDVVVMVVKDIIKRRSGVFILRTRNQHAKLVRCSDSFDW